MSLIQMLNSPGLKSISGLCSAFSLHLFCSRCWWTTAASGGAWWVLPSHRHDFSHAGDWRLGNASAIEPKVAERQSSQLRKTMRRDGAAPRPSAPLPLAACPSHKSSRDLLVLLVGSNAASFFCMRNHQICSKTCASKKIWLADSDHTSCCCSSRTRWSSC
jgi:hypothetical protein